MNGFENSTIIVHPSEWMARMRALGISLTEVARRAGISHATLSVGFRGKCNFETRTLEAVSRVILAEEERLRLHLDGLENKERVA